MTTPVHPIVTRAYRPFAVTATVTREVSFLVDARDAEEAQRIAEEWIEDGETGTVNSQEIEMEDCYPADGLEPSEERPLNRSRFLNPETLSFDEDDLD
jgi:hypothetical protein